MHELHKHSYLWIQDVLLGYLFSNIMDVDIFWETHRKRYRLRQASARYRCSQLRQAFARLQENVVSAKAPTNIFDVFLKKFNIPIMSSCTLLLLYALMTFTTSMMSSCTLLLLYALMTVFTTSSWCHAALRTASPHGKAYRHPSLRIHTPWRIRRLYGELP